MAANCTAIYAISSPRKWEAGGLHCGRCTSDELYFGRDSAPRDDARGRLISLPVLTLPARPHTLHISGTIDRLDQGESGEDEVAVIDYKSSARKSMDLFRVRHGISLQLPAYVLVLRQLARRTVLAALYVPLGLARESVGHGGEALDPDSDAFFQKRKLRGIVDARHAWLLDRGLAPADGGGGGASAWFKLRFNKSGEPDNTTDLLLNEDFELLLQFTAWKMSRLGQALAGGAIAPAPYRCGKEIPCDQCDYAAMCPFDPARDAFREVLRESKAEVLARMRDELARGTDS